MSKTLTLRLDDDIYSMFKTAAEGDRRSISNFIEYAALAYLETHLFASDGEMDEILNNKELLKGLDQGRKDIEEGKYRIV